VDRKKQIGLRQPDEHGGPMNASTLSSINSLMVFPMVTLLLHAESSDTKLQQNAIVLDPKFVA